MEVPQAQLRALNLTLGQIANAIDRAALDVPAGTLRTAGGDILLKTTERRYFASEFLEILSRAATQVRKSSSGTSPRSRTDSRRPNGIVLQRQTFGLDRDVCL